MVKNAEIQSRQNKQRAASGHSLQQIDRQTDVQQYQSVPLPLPRHPRAALPLADLWIAARARQSRASRISRFIPPVCACVHPHWTGQSLYELVRCACVYQCFGQCLLLSLPQHKTVSWYFYILFFLHNEVVILFRLIFVYSPYFLEGLVNLTRNI